MFDCFILNVNWNKLILCIKIRVIVSNFFHSRLLLRIEYYYDNNQIIKFKILTSNEPQYAELLFLIILVRTMKIKEIVLMSIQTYIVMILNYYGKK